MFVRYVSGNIQIYITYNINHVGQIREILQYNYPINAF